MKAEGKRKRAKAKAGGYAKQIRSTLLEMLLPPTRRLWEIVSYRSKRFQASRFSFGKLPRSIVQRFSSSLTSSYFMTVPTSLLESFTEELEFRQAKPKRITVTRMPKKMPRTGFYFGFQPALSSVFHFHFHFSLRYKQNLNCTDRKNSEHRKVMLRRSANGSRESTGAELRK